MPNLPLAAPIPSSPQSHLVCLRMKTLPLFIPSEWAVQAFDHHLDGALRVVLAKMPREHSQNGMYYKSAITIATENNEVIRAAAQDQKTPEGTATLRARFAGEHRLDRLAQPAIGQARYKGRRKTRFQLMLACTIANLWLAWYTVAKNGAITPWNQPYIAFWQPDVPRTASLDAISEPICKLLAF